MKCKMRLVFWDERVLLFQELLLAIPIALVPSGML